MSKKSKQLFIFFLPTVIVVLISISSYQQSILTATDSDSQDTVITRIELPSKNFGFDHLPVFSMLGARYTNLVLKSFINSITPIFLSKQKENIININNNSPPDNMFV